MWRVQTHSGLTKVGVTRYSNFVMWTLTVQMVSQCKALIEKDDAIRKELDFEVPSFSELRQYKRIRESVNEDAIWLPGKRMGGMPDRRSFFDEDEDDERYVIVCCGNFCLAFRSQDSHDVCTHRVCAVVVVVVLKQVSKKIYEWRLETKLSVYTAALVKQLRCMPVP